MNNISEQVGVVADSIHTLRGTRDRVLVAIAGAPGSGKSTIADAIIQRLNAQNCPSLIVPMDGFHLDNRILDQRGLLSRKGAPETFDADGFAAMITRLKANKDVIAPCFDRNRDLSVAGAVHIPPDVPVIVAEGNYLMFDEAPWRDLAPIWDLTVRLDVPIDELRERLIQRWIDHNLSRAAAIERAESNDIPNAQRIIKKALPSNITL